MKPMIAFAALVALAACTGSEAHDSNIAVDETVNAGEAVPLANDTAAINEADDAGSEQPTPPGTPEASMIPGQYRGRWGMNAADCDQNRSDNKGLIAIGEKSIRFYESTAVLKEQRPAIATSFAGLFAFTGEGQSWEKDMTLTRTGDTLTRADDDGTYTYKRCG